MIGDFENNEYDYYKGKVPNKTYVSKRINSKSPEIENGKVVEKIIPIRYASKVLDLENAFGFIKEKGEIKLRITPSGRQEITAKFLEDSRGIYILQIQKFTIETGSPHKTYFSFRGDEIRKLVDFIKSIKDLHIEDENGIKISDEELQKLILTKEQAFSLYRDNQAIFKEVLEENITSEEIKNLVYKKKQLDYFENLITNKDFFESEKTRLNLSRDESLWQNFFEKNTWIFGYGLQYIINIPLQNKKLEQVVDGYDIVNRGKRTDALMKSKGIINSLCFAEIKTHKTKLLNSSYRPNVYPPSNELSGGISQIQKTVQSSLENLVNKLEPISQDGDPTGEEIFMYRPKSVLLLGSLEEFTTENGINKEKYSSFELYRKSIKDIDILTFDELLERAKFIVNTTD
ncbi:MAG: Shedu immune nuclease family protein [Zunongwangia sp.]|uniref:Shedu immune nuclease family protein n=1 Tax=Zunongwangia sp. TaxID=1965325 RepID=UPI003242C736